MQLMREFLIMLPINKYLIAGLGCLLSNIIIAFYAYNTGIKNERNSLENQQKATVIAYQKKVIEQQTQSMSLTNQQLTTYSNELNQQIESYQQLKRNLDNEKNLLNRTNHINALFVRIISDDNRTMSKISKSTAGISKTYTESTDLRAVSASSVAGYIILKDNLYRKVQLQCNSAFLWYKNQYQLFNK